MRNAMWFSRHAPTAEQLAEIQEMGLEIPADILAEGMALGARNINSEDDMFQILNGIWDLARACGAEHCFGMFPAPILLAMQAARDAGSLRMAARRLRCFAAWNAARAAEGGKPTFSHLRWCAIGELTRGIED